MLVGLMGVGKSTVGAVLASALGRELVDSDLRIEALTGRTVKQILADDGVGELRRHEAAALFDAIDDPEPRVIAAAGGVVLDPANRERIDAADVDVVWLTADPRLLAPRTASREHRPWLDGDPVGTLQRMESERGGLYREIADVTVPVDGLTPDAVADVVLAELRRGPREHPSSPRADRRPRVRRGGRPRGGSRVAVAAAEHGSTDRDRHPAERAARDRHQRSRTRCSRSATVSSSRPSTPSATCAADSPAWDSRAHDVVVGIGGGMVTDVAGFAAASYHRGIPVVHVATTLLGMVDAAIGGKTGVNLPEGKNLVGAFWQPSGVVCDLDALVSLPERELRCGYGEMAKYHFLSGDDLLAMPLTDRVARCVEIKAEFVAADEREGGRRALLNYGHTLAHAAGDRDRASHRPWRGGGDRVGVRGPSGARARSDRRRSASTSTCRSWVSSTGSPPTCRAGSATSVSSN